MRELFPTAETVELGLAELEELGHAKFLVATAVSDWFMLNGEKARPEECTSARRRTLLQLCRINDLEVNTLQALEDFDYPEDPLRNRFQPS